MGNCSAKLRFCCGGAYRRRHDVAVIEPLDEGLGHSYCYVRPDPYPVPSSKIHSEETTTFRSISGASVSANTSTPLSTAFVDLHSYSSLDRAAAFECSTSFASVPLQPVPRCWVNNSGPFVLGSGPIERGFLSGPIERGFMSGPIDSGLFSCPLEKDEAEQFKRSLSHGDFGLKARSKKGSLVGDLKRAIAKKINRGQNNSVVVVVKEPDWVNLERNMGENLTVNSNFLSSEGSLEYEECLESHENLQWAQGKAGEDRVQVVISEEHGWVFVGIYDGFNGPDAPDFLCSNLYSAVQEQLKGLLWEDDYNSTAAAAAAATTTTSSSNSTLDDNKVLVSIQNEELNHSRTRNWTTENYPSGGLDLNSNSKKGRSKNSKNNRFKGAGKKWEENQRRWKCEWDRERLELDRKLKEISSLSGSKASDSVNHSDVLKALSQALKNTEESFLDITDMMSVENPELALMGSCVLVMLMKGEDVYVINVGDSRAVLAQKPELDLRLGHDLEQINDEDCSEDDSDKLPCLTALQLTLDHSTTVEEEVQRIKNGHTDDASVVTNDRVKGSLKVTRAFGAGFLKKPKWNNALLEMFRINYIGTSPYITCVPSLYHHRLGPRDRFLILSSDGLYQYFTNEEAVAEVEQFIALSPEGDPAQHLVEEVLFRAAKKAGMDFHDLLEIPQGDRRRYHDDVSIIIISFEGRIWRSFAQIEKSTN